MENTYMDNPKDIETLLEALSPKERDCFNQGYITALNGVLENLVDSKRKILLKMMDTEEEDVLERLQAKLNILDKYDDHYRKRVNRLSALTS